MCDEEEFDSRREATKSRYGEVRAEGEEEGHRDMKRRGW